MKIHKIFLSWIISFLFFTYASIAESGFVDREFLESVGIKSTPAAYNSNEAWRQKVLVMEDGFYGSHDLIKNNLVKSEGFFADNRPNFGNIKDNDHGTAVAGVIPQISPHSKIIPYCFGKSRDILPTLKAAALSDSPIVNISWGLEYSLSADVKNAIKKLATKGKLVVFAAGNEQTRIKYEPFYASLAKLANDQEVNGRIIIAGASKKDGEFCTFSNRPDVWLEARSNFITCTGQNITTAAIRHSSALESVNGTSFSAPAICAIFSRLLMEYPDLTIDCVRKLVFDSTVKTLKNKPLDPNFYGHGIANYGQVVEKLESYKVIDKLPADFNAKLYIQMHPGLKNEAAQKGMNPITYAKWQYVFYGQYHGLNYLPKDFNTELYIQMHPGLKNEAAQKGMDPTAYAKWQYAFYGYNHGLNYLPTDFNAELYIQIHPGLKNEAAQKGMDSIAYAKWQYAFYGYNHGLNYLPTDFNAELYIKIHPGLKNEAAQKGMDSIAYAKWQYAFYGQYHGLNYLPTDFNAELYIKIHPGLRNEAARKGMDSIAYAKWQYAFYGQYHGLNYLPTDFNAELYIKIHPELRNEAARKGMDSIAYAKWQYAFYGYNHGLNYLPADFNANRYILMHPGLRNEARQKGMDLIAYAKWQYAFYGYYHGLKYLP